LRWVESTSSKHARAALLLALIVPLVGLALLRLARKPTGAFSPAPPRLDVSALDKIQLGMSEEQITRIIGVPPGDYTTRPVECYIAAGLITGASPPAGTTKKWLFNSRCVFVCFRDGKAVDFQCGQGLREWAWIEKWLGIELFALRD